MAPPARLVSIIVEWENAGRIGTRRARTMLDELQRQLGEAEVGLGRFELVFVGDGAADERSVREAVAEAGLRRAAVRFVAAPGCDYYEQKNRGAESARGDIFLFLDSDVLPEPGWLAGLLAPFADPSVSIVAGTSFIAVEGLYSAAMALGWIFPVRGEGGPLARSPTFFANNVAFRADLFRRHPFPRLGQYRGQCIALAEELRGAGQIIYMNHAAAVSHPAPEGLSGFAIRALRRGHDETATLRRRQRAVLRNGSAATARQLAAAFANVRKRHREVGLGPAGAIAAGAILLAYYALQLAGLVAAAIAPSAARRWLVGAQAREATARIAAARG
ncbi:MAG TPA: glycosyltransferase [Allosphingosinicella sp.]